MKILLHALSLVAGIGLLVLLALYVGLEETLGHLRRLDPLLLLPVTVLYTASWLVRAARLQRLLGIFRRSASLPEALGVEIGGNFANLVAPAKLGDAVKVLYLRREKDMPLLQGTLAAVLVRVLDLFTVLVLILGAVLFLSEETVRAYGTTLRLGGALVAAALLGLAVVAFRPGLVRPLLRGPLARLDPLLRRIHATLRGNLRTIAGLLLLSAVVWVFDSWVLKLFLDAYDVQLHFAEVVFVLMMANLVKSLPVTPGAIGVLEGVLVGLLVALGVDSGVALAVSVLDHGYKNLFTLVLGAIFLRRLGLGLAGAAAARSPEPIGEGASEAAAGDGPPTA